MNKLISMVDRVLGYEYDKTRPVHSQYFDKWKAYETYANFLNTPLNLSMFVPCKKVGDEWEVLDEPKPRLLDYNNPMMNQNDFIMLHERFEKAKENVLFEGCISAEYKEGLFYLKFINDFTLVFQDSDTVEWLVDEDITLTENGMIKSGLK